MTHKSVIFGAGQIGHRLCIYLQQNKDSVLYFVDNNPSLWDTEVCVNGIRYKIFNPIKLKEKEDDYDVIHIAVRDAVNEISAQCVTSLGVPQEKINHLFLSEFMDNIGQKYLQCRIWFLENFSEIAKVNVAGAVAEVGVFRGAFAAEINRCFADRTLYLYDTFEGFDDRDIEMEAALSEDINALRRWRDSMGNFEFTSADYVLSQMPYPTQCQIRQGYFPETFKEQDEQFAFVNLDCDLYGPIKAGLELFYPKMARGGVILVHEYFDEIDFLPGIKHAVHEFIKEHNCIAIPIGDKQSIAVIKS